MGYGSPNSSATVEKGDGFKAMLTPTIAEFAVSGIQDITWTNLPFDTLVIPAKTKEMLQALVHNQIPDPNKPAFDDFIEGKGKGLIVLLQ